MPKPFHRVSGEHPGPHRRTVLGAAAVAATMVGGPASAGVSKPHVVYTLARSAPFQRILGWDVEPGGARAVVAGPLGDHVEVIDLAHGGVRTLAGTPFVGNPDPTLSLIKFADANRICWPAAAGNGAWDLVVADVESGRLTRRPLGAGRPRDIAVSGGRVFVLMQNSTVVVAALDGDRAMNTLPVESALGLIVGHDGGVFALETRRSPEAIASGNIVREEASRTFRVRALSSPTAASVDFDAHGGPGSRAGALPDGGWALLAEPMQLENAHIAARLTLFESDGRPRQSLPVGPPNVQPASVAADASGVYFSFVASDQPVQKLTKGERIASTFHAPGGALALLARQGRLYFRNTDKIGYFA